MHSFVGTIMCSVLILSTAAAADDDTIKTYHANEVVVTATRTAINSDDAPSSVQVINADAIQQTGAKTVADALMLVTGAYVRDYGATGGMKTVLIHGVSSGNITILLDGNPINDPENGNVDLSLLPLSSFDRIEVVNGSTSALYGGNALGGVINLITRKASDGVHVRVQQELGSFDAERTAIELQGSTTGIKMLGGYSIETGNDNFPFTFQATDGSEATMYRKDADYRRKNAYWKGDDSINSNTDLSASVHYVKFERGAPDPIYSTDDESASRLNDETLRLAFGVNTQIAERMFFSLNTVYNKSTEQYLSPVYGDSIPTDQWYHEKFFTLNSSLRWNPFINDQVLLGVEYGGSILNGDGIGHYWDSYYTVHRYLFSMVPSRYQRSAYLSNSYTVNTSIEWFDQIILFQTLRYDAYSDISSDAVSPKLGMNIRVYKPNDVHIRGNWGKNFRVPTFNELYYPYSNNPDLNPEHSNSFDLGLSGSVELSGLHEFHLNYFYVDAKNKIVYQSLYPYLPYNIAKATHQGIDARYDYHSIDNIVDIYIGGTYLEALDKSSPADSTYGKQLVYVPQSTGMVGVTIKTPSVQFNIHESWIGKRYTATDNTQWLPCYALTDLTVNTVAPFFCETVNLQLTVKNVFNRDYQIYSDYPMPGRSFRISAAIEY